MKVAVVGSRSLCVTNWPLSQQPDIGAGTRVHPEVRSGPRGDQRQSKAGCECKALREILRRIRGNGSDPDFGVEFYGDRGAEVLFLCHSFGLLSERVKTGNLGPCGKLRGPVFVKEEWSASPGLVCPAVPGSGQK